MTARPAGPPGSQGVRKVLVLKGPGRHSLGFPRQNWRTYRLWFAGGYAALLLLLMALAIFGLWMLGAVRAYVAGEGFWSKAQKDAVAHLRRYARFQGESHYQDFLDELSVPLADHQARIELQKPNADLGAAAEAFIRGRNHPDDAPAMARLFRYFHSEAHLRRAIDIWKRGDDYIDELRSLGASLHDEFSTKSPDHASVDRLLAEVESVNDQLTPLENDFSQTLGSGARFAQFAFYIALAVLAALLIGAGGLISGRLLHRIRVADIQYRQFLSTARDGIFITERQTGAILEVNRSAEEMAGMDSGRLQGKRFQDLLQPLEQSLGADPLHPDSLMRGADGRELRVDVRSSIARIHDIEVAVNIVRDVTDQRRFQERSAEAARMEALGRLGAGIAHDFNNILSGIEVYASDAREYSRTPVLREALDQILRAARSGADLVQHLMAFSRNQQLMPQVFDVNEAICAVVPFINRLLGPGIELTTTLDQAGLPIRADRSCFEQVIINIAANGRDAMPQGGILSLQTSRMNPAEIAQLGRPVPFHGDGVLISVSDRGDGIAPELQGRVFDPFFTTKPLGRGSGLGLSSVFGTVRQSGGDVWMSSAPGMGATIWILLPVIAN